MLETRYIILSTNSIHKFDRDYFAKTFFLFFWSILFPANHFFSVCPSHFKVFGSNKSKAAKQNSQPRPEGEQPKFVLSQWALQVTIVTY